MGITNLSEFLGVENLSIELQSLTKRFALIYLFHWFIWMTTTTFLVMYVVDEVGIGVVGILTGVLFLTQSLFDYPLGVMSDSIGQRWVLSLGWFIFVIVDILLIFANNFSDFMIIYILGGIGFALFSGAYETWFDNNYQALVVDDDPDRRVYGFVIGRRETIFQLAAILGIVFGGIIATVFSRKFAFLLRAIGGLIMIFVIMVALKDRYKKQRKKKSNLGFIHQYFGTTKNGILFLFSSKKTFYLLLAQTLLIGIWAIWLNFIAFVIFFGYSGSDDIAGIIRTLISIGIIITGMVATRLSMKIHNSKWIFHLILFHFIIFFGGFALLLWTFPLSNQFDLFVLTLLLLIIIISDPLVKIANILIQRVIVDVVPTDIRNSVYSLVPSLAALIAFPFMIIVGFAIENISFSFGMIILGVLGIFNSFLFYVSNKFSDFSTPV